MINLAELDAQNLGHDLFDHKQPVTLMPTKTTHTNKAFPAAAPGFPRAASSRGEIQLQQSDRHITGRSPSLRMARNGPHEVSSAPLFEARQTSNALTAPPTLWVGH